MVDHVILRLTGNPRETGRVRECGLVHGLRKFCSDQVALKKAVASRTSQASRVQAGSRGRRNARHA